MEQLTILIVDDDHEIVRIVSAILKQENYNITTANNGDEALQILQSRLVHLIIMDVMMPKINGLLATVKIREKSNIPILMLSARTEENDRVMGLSMGADDYLTKPFYKSELLARVNSLLRRYIQLGSISDKKSSSVMEYYDLVLDREKKKFLVRGQAIQLTATEYKIVELLLGRPSKVFSAEEIYESVWNNDAFSIENTVMIHISRIREKIEINPKRPEYLKVVWGVGYKIEKT
ncbi:MAG: response regulator transcription factor [Bacillota bacterium]|nr:response regulator transcription factor [Bacillota bacterium]